ncbi:unnamed protein product [Rhizophagus irregularis]|nr:unnamed protein product [Rhizophagus irregularis]
MSQQRIINNLDEFRQQALRGVNEAIFTLNNSRGDRHRLSYCIDRVERLKQMLQTMNNILNETFMENIMNSLQELQNQLHDAMEYTNERDVTI